MVAIPPPLLTDTRRCRRRSYWLTYNGASRRLPQKRPQPNTETVAHVRKEHRSWCTIKATCRQQFAGMLALALPPLEPNLTSYSSHSTSKVSTGSHDYVVNERSRSNLGGYSRVTERVLEIGDYSAYPSSSPSSSCLPLAVLHHKPEVGDHASLVCILSG